MWFVILFLATSLSYYFDVFDIKGWGVSDVFIPFIYTAIVLSLFVFLVLFYYLLREIIFGEITPIEVNEIQYGEENHFSHQISITIKNNSLDEYIEDLFVHPIRITAIGSAYLKDLQTESNPFKLDVTQILPDKSVVVVLADIHGDEHKGYITKFNIKDGFYNSEFFHTDIPTTYKASYEIIIGVSGKVGEEKILNYYKGVFTHYTYVIDEEESRRNYRHTDDGDIVLWQGEMLWDKFEAYRIKNERNIEKKRVRRIK